MSARQINCSSLSVFSIKDSVRRCYVDRFYHHHVSQLRDGLRVLDVGGNKEKKKGRFDLGAYNVQSWYSNISRERIPDVQADACILPFAAESFDAIICSEVLEHVQDPVAVLREMHRVLRKDGRLLLCVPFMIRIHGDPHDYGRYTDQYWLAHLEKTGFRDIGIEQQGYFWSVLLEMFRAYACYRSDSSTLYGKLMRRIYAKLLNWSRYRVFSLESKAHYGRDSFFAGYTTGYGIVARKGS